MDKCRRCLCEYTPKYGCDTIDHFIRLLLSGKSCSTVIGFYNSVEVFLTGFNIIEGTWTLVFEEKGERKYSVENLISIAVENVPTKIKGPFLDVMLTTASNRVLYLGVTISGFNDDKFVIMLGDGK